MKKYAFLLIFLMVLLRGVYGQSVSNILLDNIPINSIDKIGWVLIFQDDFDADSLNTQKWNPQEGTHGTELQYYRNRKENIFFKDGYLHFRAIQDSFKSMPYTSGMIFSAINFDKESLVEIRCKIPKGKGLWPAFWFWRGAWDSTYQELDAFEFWGDNTERFCISNHYWDEKKKTVSTHFKWVQPKTARGQKIDMSQQFFTYTAYWDSKNIKVLLNNRLVAVLKEDIPIHPFPLILNLAVDGGNGKKPDNKTVFPADFILDYVRVYKRIKSSTN